MRSVNFKDFAALPPGTVFSYYDPNIVRGLMIKGETLCADGEAIDFFLELVLPEHFRREDDHFGKYGPDCTTATNPAAGRQRWGEFDFDSMFLVYDLSDVQFMTTTLLANVR